jgi:RecA-family ATPase
MFKTFAALDLAASVVTGNSFAGHKVMRAGGVLFIAAEGGSGINIRFKTIMKEKYQIETPMPFFWIEESPMLLGNAPGVAKLTNVAKAASEEMQRDFAVPLVLIIVDTLIAVAGFKEGGENDNAQGQQIMTILSGIAKQVGSVIMAIDHFGKDTERGGRGGSAKEACGDFILANLGDRNIDGAKSKTRMAVRKQKDGKDGFEIPFDVKEIEIGQDYDGDPVTTVIIEWQKPQREMPRRTSKRWTALNAALDVALSDHGKEVQHRGRTLTAVSRANLLDAFKGAYRGNPDHVRSAFHKALADAGEAIVSFEVQGDQFFARKEEAF